MCVFVHAYAVLCLSVCLCVCVCVLAHACAVSSQLSPFVWSFIVKSMEQHIGQKFKANAVGNCMYGSHAQRS